MVEFSESETPFHHFVILLSSTSFRDIFADAHACIAFFEDTFQIFIAL